MLLLLENNWDRWTDMARSGNDRSSDVPTLYTASPNPAASPNPKSASDDASRNDNDNGEETAETRNQFSGWSTRGLERFNHFVDLLGTQRRHRHKLEEQFLTICKKNNSEAQIQAKKKRKLQADMVTARNTLFQPIGDSSAVPVDAMDDPYGDVTTMMEL